MWLNKLASHLLEAVRIMLPLLTSFPLEEFVLSIAAEAYFMARKQLVKKMVNKSNFWNVKKKAHARKCIDAHDVHKGFHGSVCQRMLRANTRLMMSPHISR